MTDRAVIKSLLKAQDSEKIEEFVNILLAFTDDLMDDGIDIKQQPFKKTVEGSKNVQTLEYKQLASLHVASKQRICAENEKESLRAERKLKKALQNFNNPDAIKRLSGYLKVAEVKKLSAYIGRTTQNNFEIHLAMHVYNAVNYAFYHGECTRTGGRADKLNGIEKLKLRRLKSLFKRYFPHLSYNLNGENNIIHAIGCCLVEKNSLGKNPDDSIEQKSLSMTRFKKT